MYQLKSLSTPEVKWSTASRYWNILIYPHSHVDAYVVLFLAIEIMMVGTNCPWDNPGQLFSASHLVPWWALDFGSMAL